VGGTGAGEQGRGGDEGGGSGQHSSAPRKVAV